MTPKKIMDIIKEQNTGLHPVSSSVRRAASSHKESKLSGEWFSDFRKTLFLRNKKMRKDENTTDFSLR